MSATPDDPLYTFAHQRLVALLREKSVRRGQFTLASGKTSDLYVDVRQTSLNAEGAALIASLMFRRLHADVAAVGGLTLGADPIACAIAPYSYTAGRPIHAFLIRKEAKDHGTGNVVEGRANLAEGMAVAIVEDTTTTGGSLLKAVVSAQAIGLRVVQCLTVVDREEGAAEALAERGFTLDALVTRTQLLNDAGVDPLAQLLASPQ